MGGFISGIRCLFSNRKDLKGYIIAETVLDTRHELITQLYTDSCTTETDRKEICNGVLDNSTAMDQYAFLYCFVKISQDEFIRRTREVFPGKYLTQFLADLLEESFNKSVNGELLIDKNATIMHINLKAFLEDQGDRISDDNTDTIVQLERVLFELDKIQRRSGGSRKRRKPRKRSQTRLIRR